MRHARSCPLHRPPRRPHAWLPWLRRLAAGRGRDVVALGLARWGCRRCCASHLPLAWATLQPAVAAAQPGADAAADRRARGVADHRRRPVGRDPRRCWTCSTRTRAKATFFVVGDRARGAAAAGRARSRAAATARQPQPLASVGVVLGAAAGADARARSTQHAGAAGATSPATPPRWFRAVVGMANPFVAAALKRHGLARVAWCARGFDAVAADPARVVARIERGLRPGRDRAAARRRGARPQCRDAGVAAAAAGRAGYRTLLPEPLEADGGR